MQLGRILHRANRNTVLFSLATFYIACDFNACSPAHFVMDETSKSEELNSAAAIFIDNDAPYTKLTSRQVQLSTSNHLADEMYVTNDPTCKTGGT